MTSVLIPLHNSASELSLPQASRLMTLAIGHDDRDNTGSNNDSTHHVQMLNLQCNSEGVHWRCIVPLLSQPADRNSWRYALTALAVLIGHYKDDIYTIQHEHNMMHEDHKHNEQTLYEDQQYFGISAHHISDWLVVTVPHMHKSGTHIIITIHPPNPIYSNIKYSRTPSSRPTNTFPLRLIAYENSQIRLQSISAYLSTLGGGYFLCHHLSTALLMAKKQCEVAQLRGDEDMVWRCRINMGYCWFYAGKLKRGRRVVRCVLKEVSGRLKENEDGSLQTDTITDLLSLQMTDYQKKKMCNLTIIKNMCLSALWFADRVQEAKLKEEEDESVTHDDYKRVRVVKDRSTRV